MKKITAFLTAAVMLSTALPAMPVSAEYTTKPIDAGVPQWVPDTFEEALEFCNTYGETRAADGVYCIVDRWNSELGPKCDETLTAGSAERICEKVIRYEPKDGLPDLSQMSEKERAEWEERLEEQGRIEAYNKNVYYFVSVWKPTQPAYCEINRQYSFQAGGTNAQPQTYSFHVATDALHVAEAGWRAYVPDCITEYNAFLEEYGNLHIEDDMLVMAGTVNYSTGADMNMTVNLNGQAKEPLGRINCREQGLTEPPPGTSEKIVQYYQFKFGQTGRVTATIDWTESRPEYKTSVTGYYSSVMDTSGRVYLEERDARPSENLPDWVPTDYRAACAFDNRYGSTHTEDGLICVVNRHDGAAGADGSDIPSRWFCTPLVGSNTPAECDRLADEWYQRAPDGSDDNIAHYYHVSVWKPTSEGLAVFCEEDIQSDKQPDAAHTYQFRADADLNITEFGWQAYVPDCHDEFTAFINSAGNDGMGLGNKAYTQCNIDGKGDYLVLAAQNIGLIGSYMRAEAVMDGKKLSLTGVNCDTRWDGPEPTDVGGSAAQYCRITQPGTITVSYTNTYYDELVTTQVLDAIKDTSGAIRVVRRQNETAPAWTPKDFASAEEFFKYYGMYRSESGSLVIVLPYTVDPDFDYELEEPKEQSGYGKQKMLSEKRYTDGDRGYLVRAYNISTPTSWYMNWQKKPKTASGAKKQLYKLFFEVSDMLVAEETDVHGLLPYSYSSAETALKENGYIYVKNGFLICSGRTNPSTGYSIIPELSGSAAADPVTRRSFSLNQNPDIDGGERAVGGGSKYDTFMFKPVKPGILKVNLRHAREWDYNDGTISETKYFTVGEDLSVKEIQIQKGDLDGDGELTTADLVLLTKYLGCQAELTEKQFYAADMINDNRINAADLSVMKRWLMEIKNPPPPAA